MSDPLLIELLRKALVPFAEFADKWDANPLVGIHDEVYSIHSGEDQGMLRLSDCKMARAILELLALEMANRNE